MNFDSEGSPFSWQDTLKMILTAAIPALPFLLWQWGVI